MADISAKVVMDLRNETGLSMMECKKALAETGGDFEKAKDYLRKHLKGKMDSRTDRAAGAGRVAVATAGDKLAVIEVRAETDFTAMNEKFVAMADNVAKQAIASPAGAVPVDATITAAVDELRISTGENCSFARGQVYQGGTIGYYVHHDGKTVGVIQVDGAAANDVLKQICMHIVANPIRPLGITPNDIPAAAVEKEKKFRLEQAMESGKPQQIAEKMVEGGMKKFFEDVALSEQPLVSDPSKKIKDMLGAAKIKAFARWQVGEAL
jgi:elongation factor Ts